MTPALEIGFIGLGAMGWPMAARLVQAGHHVRVHDVRTDTASRFCVDMNAKLAHSASDAALKAQLVITMLPTSEDVRTAVLGSNGAAESMSRDAVLVDMTSGSPSVTREIGATISKLGLRMADAPASGGVKGAREGTLALMTGGDEDALALASPALTILGSQIFHVGPLGAGQAMKALNNMLSAAGLLIAGEALVIGQRFGLDPETMIDVFNASTGRNNSTERKLKPYVLSGSYAGGFALRLMVKDLTIALELADQTGTPACLSHACQAAWQRANSNLPGSSDHTEIIRDLGFCNAGAARKPL